MICHHIKYTWKSIIFQRSTVGLFAPVPIFRSPVNSFLFFTFPHSFSNYSLAPSPSACSPRAAFPASPPLILFGSCVPATTFSPAMYKIWHYKFSIRWSFSRRPANSASRCSPYLLPLPSCWVLWSYPEGCLYNGMVTIWVFEGLYLFLVGFYSVSIFIQHFIKLLFLLQQDFIRLLPFSY